VLILRPMATKRIIVTVGTGKAGRWIVQHLEYYLR
jgi:hypothetical protein